MRKLTIAALAAAPPGRPIGAPGESGVRPGSVAIDAVGEEPAAVFAVDQGRIR